jgi:hypothetical protein
VVASCSPAEREEEEANNLLEVLPFDFLNNIGDSIIQWEPAFELPSREDTIRSQNAMGRENEFVDVIEGCAFDEHCAHQEQQHVNKSALDNILVEVLSTPIISSCLRRNALLEHVCSITDIVAAFAEAEADNDHEQGSSRFALDPAVLNITTRIAVPKRN